MSDVLDYHDEDGSRLHTDLRQSADTQSAQSASMVLEGYVQTWLDAPDGRHEATIILESGHAITVPWIGDDFDAPPPGVSDRVRVMLTLLRDADHTHESASHPDYGRA